MPVQIDRMDTSIEITQPVSSTSGVSRPSQANSPDPRARETLRDLVGQLMSEELDRFMRNRGM